MITDIIILIRQNRCKEVMLIFAINNPKNYLEFLILRIILFFRVIHDDDGWDLN